MTPELERLIATFPDLTEEQAKLIFVRKSAQEAFEKGELEESTSGMLKEVVTIITCSNMHNIEEFIGNLEKARNYLASYTQGVMSAHASDIEPKIKAKREKERLQKQVKTKDKKVNDLIQMAINAATIPDTKVVSSNKKIHCSKCDKDVYSLNYHNCSPKEE